jgi:hypothetical protein
MVDTVKVVVPVPPEERMTRLEPSEADRLDTDNVAARLILPANPVRLVSVMLEAPKDP